MNGKRIFFNSGESSLPFGEKVIRFLCRFREEHPELPSGIELLNPYPQYAVRKAVTGYYRTYYNGHQRRIFVFGINPGRLGAGITGIPFTDPVALSREAHIVNPFPQKPEPSSTFIYDFIRSFGGLEIFAKTYFLTSVCPLGFTEAGRNYNYYDDRRLMDAVEPFILRNVSEQLLLGAVQSVAVCLGEGKNFDALSRWNEREGWFEEIVPLPHPRFIMQYRRNRKDEFMERYIDLFTLLRESDGSEPGGVK